jgi:hypothetical protein
MPASADRVIAGSSVTCGGAFFGVWSTGAGASEPWKFWPTTTVAIAPFASVDSVGGSGFTSASPNRFPSCVAAPFAFGRVAS